MAPIGPRADRAAVRFDPSFGRSFCLPKVTPCEVGALGNCATRPLRILLAEMCDASRLTRTSMTDNEDPFSNLAVQQTIDLRWTLRDIKANAGNCPRSTRPI